MRFNPIIVCSVASLSLSLATSLAVAPGASESRVLPAPVLPLCFESSPNQAGAFSASSPNAHFLVQPASVEMTVSRVLNKNAGGPEKAADMTETSLEARTFRMRLAGANDGAALEGSNRFAGSYNYLSGPQSQWRVNVPTWKSVKATAVYPGVDVVYYGTERQLEYDFCVAAGASADSIRLQFQDVDNVSIGSGGELVLKLGGATVRQHRPVAYQIVDGSRQPVSVEYVLLDKDTAGFKLGSFRKDLELVIDPVLSYSTFFGGGGGEVAMAVRLGPDRSIYIAGETVSRRFAFSRSPGVLQPAFRGGSISGDAFVARFDATGANLLYYTYLGGTGDDGALDLAVDQSGNAYVAGFTISADFPMRHALIRQIQGKKDPAIGAYPKDAFVAILNPEGTDLLFSSYWGGTGADSATGIAVDANGAFTVVGTTVSANFPTRNALPGGARKPGLTDAFVTRFAPGGTDVVFSTYLGGSRTDAGQGVACDSAGNIYVTGYTASPNFPIKNAFQTQINSVTNANAGLDAYISKLSPEGSLLYSTFLGGWGNDAAYRIAVDGAGAAYITGYATSVGFPNTLTNLVGLANGKKLGFSNTDAFLTKVTTDGAGVAQLAYSALLGGASSDVGWDVATASNGDAYVIGMSTSRFFGTNWTNWSTATGILKATNSGGSDIFVLGLKSDASAVIYSGFLGGRRSDYGYGITVGPDGLVYLTGRTISPNFPLQSPFQSRKYGNDDTFITVLSGQ